MVPDSKVNSKTGIFMAREGLSMLMAPYIQAGLKMGEETAGGSIQMGKFIDDKFQGQDDLQYRQGKNKYY
jgi:hypothetical protein